MKFLNTRREPFDEPQEYCCHLYCDSVGDVRNRADMS